MAFSAQAPDTNSISSFSSESTGGSGCDLAPWVETVLVLLLNTEETAFKQCHPIDQQPRCWAPDSGAEGH